MNKTKIEWVKNPDGSQGYTWNPLSGCLNHVNGMCKGGGFPCYAYRLANGRLKQRYLTNQNLAPLYEGGHNFAWESRITDPFYPRFWPERIYAPCDVKKPSGIFVADMGELFGDWVPDLWQHQILETIQICPQHRFYLLTKQPQNLIKFSPFPDNCWVGVTATDRRYFNMAIGNLAQVKAKVRFISFEPLLNTCQHSTLPYLEAVFKEGNLDWLIIGAQTKPYKPPKLAWVQEIVEVADKVEIPVFLKDNLKPMIPPEVPTFYTLADPHNEVNQKPMLRQEMPDA